MPNNQEQLDELFRELELPSFWEEVREQRILEQQHLKNADYYHGPKWLNDELKRQKEAGVQLPFVRRFLGRRYCELPIAEAEQEAQTEETRAAEVQAQIADRQEKHNLLKSLLRDDAPLLASKLPPWEKLFEKRPRTAARKIEWLYYHWLERVKSTRGLHNRLCRGQVRLDRNPPQVICDGTAYEVSEEIAQFYQAMIDANGQPVSMTSHDVRSREIGKLPKELRALIKRSAGKGCWIPQENLWRN